MTRHQRALAAPSYEALYPRGHTAERAFRSTPEAIPGGDRSTGLAKIAIAKITCSLIGMSARR